MGVADRQSMWGGKKLPYKKRVAYLESTGSQYINTGTNQNAIYGFSLDFTPIQDLYPNYATLLGGITDHFTVGWQTNYNNLIYIRIRGIDIGTGTPGSTGIGYETGQRIVLTLQNNIAYKNDVQYPTRSFGSPFGTNSAEVFLFSGSSGSRPSSYFYIHGLEIYGALNVLLRDFIPVIDNDNVPCMYDQVSEQFFYNEGSGDFIAGPTLADSMNEG